MAIEIRHGLSPAAVAAAAFGGGQGQARAPLAAAGAAAGLRERLAAADQQAAQQRLAFQADEAERARQQAVLTAEQDQEHALERIGYQAQLAAAGRAQQQGELETGYTARQRMALEQLAEAEADALASPDFSPEEKSELRRRFAARRADIQPVERPRQPTPAELFKAKTFQDQRTGTIYPLDENGLPGRAIYEPPQKETSQQDIISAFEKASAFALNAAGEKPDPKALEERTTWALNQLRALGMALPGGAPPVAPAGAVPGAAAPFNENLYRQLTAGTEIPGETVPTQQEWDAWRGAPGASWARKQMAQDSPGAASAPEPEIEDARLRVIESGPIGQVTEPEAIDNLPTVQAQLKEAEVAYAAAPVSRDPTTAQRTEAMGERVKALRARRAELQEERERLQARQVMRETARERVVGASPAPPPTLQRPSTRDLRDAAEQRRREREILSLRARGKGGRKR